MEVRALVLEKVQRRGRNVYARIGFAGHEEVVGAVFCVCVCAFFCGKLVQGFCHYARLVPLPLRLPLLSPLSLSHMHARIRSPG